MSCFNKFIGTQDTKFQLDMSVYNKNSLMRCTGSCKINDPTRVFRKYKFCKKIKDTEKFLCTHNDYYIYGDGTKILNKSSIDIVRSEGGEDREREPGVSGTIVKRPEEELPEDYDTRLAVCTHIINNLKPERADDYHDWFRVCCGLHNSLQGTEDGFNLFIKFSQKSPKFDRRACENLWNNLDPKQTDNPVTLATLTMFYNRDMNPLIRRKLGRNP
jgi:hypothetical protein